MNTRDNGQAMYYDREGNPMSTQDWSSTFGAAVDRTVARSAVTDTSGVSVMISTVWLGINHNFAKDGPPLIFETMVFGGKLDELTERYPNEEEALAGHEQAVAKVQES